MTIRELMGMAPVIPVLSIDDPERAVPLGRALVAGGLRVLEVTLRTPRALEALSAINSEVEGALAGVGTVLEPEQLSTAVRAGARFAVSPGLTSDLAHAAAAMRLPFLPGVMTPSDIMAAWSLGLRELKFFPARAAGGVAMLESLAGPFPGIAFCPTGGIDLGSAPSYLALPNVVCVGGSWMAPKQLIRAGDWTAIGKLASEAAALNGSS